MTIWRERPALLTAAINAISKWCLQAQLLQQKSRSEAGKERACRAEARATRWWGKAEPDVSFSLCTRPSSRWVSWDCSNPSRTLGKTPPSRRIWRGSGWRAWPCGTEVGVDRVEHARARLPDEVADSRGAHGPEVPAHLPAAARQQRRDHVELLGIFRSVTLGAAERAKRGAAARGPCARGAHPQE